MFKRVSSFVDQIIQVIYERIISNVYPVGSMLPSENKLTEEMGVSRSTIREALKSLEAKGFIYRRQGVGSFVSDRSALLSLRLNNFQNFETIIESRGSEPSRFDEEPIFRIMTPNEAQKMHIPEPCEAVELRYLYFSDDIPVIYLIHILPLCCLKPGITAQSNNLNIPFPELLNQYSPEPLCSVRTLIEPILVDELIGEKLNLPIGTPILKMSDAFYDKHGNKFGIGFGYFNGKKFETVATFTLDQTLG